GDARPASARRGHAHGRPVPAAVAAPPARHALRAPGRLRDVPARGRGDGLHQRRERADGALLLSRRPPGDGRRRRLTPPVTFQFAADLVAPGMLADDGTSGPSRPTTAGAFA